MDLPKVKKQWEEYNKEFDSSEFMDIDTHTSMALKVGVLISYIEELEKQLEMPFINDAYAEPTPKRTFKL